MINLRATTENKLLISRGTSTADEECKPWGLEINDNTVKITALMGSTSVYEDHYSDFAVNGVPFATLSDCVNYITPCLGFNTAPGGSGAGPLIETVTLSAAQISDLGNTQVQLLPTLPVGQYYDIEQITCKLTAGTTIYTAEILEFYGAFNSFVTEEFISSIFSAVAIAKASLGRNWTSGGAYYNKVQRSQDFDFNALYVATNSGNNPMNGDGSLTFVIKYRIENF